MQKTLPTKVLVISQAVSDVYVSTSRKLVSKHELKSRWWSQILTAGAAEGPVYVVCSIHVFCINSSCQNDLYLIVGKCFAPPQTEKWEQRRSAGQSSRGGWRRGDEDGATLPRLPFKIAPFCELSSSGEVFKTFPEQSWRRREYMKWIRLCVSVSWDSSVQRLVE